MEAPHQPGTLQVEIPLHLLDEMQALVAAGWFRDLNEIVLDAVRRFLDFHRAELLEELIRQDVEWGLHGSD